MEANMKASGKMDRLGAKEGFGMQTETLMKVSG
jgi:hypothetical protein